MIVGHIIGIPVEETVLQFAPGGAAIVTAVAIAGRTGLGRLRRRLRDRARHKNGARGRETHRPRRPFSTARRMRQRVFGSSRSPQRRPFSSSSPTRIPVASRTSTASAYLRGMSGRTASIWTAVGGVGSSRSSRGRRTWTRSRAGLSLTPAKSSTCARTLRLLRIVSRLRPAACRAATSPATSAGVLSSMWREPSSGRTRLSWTRWPTAVPSVTSSRETRQRSANWASVGVAAFKRSS